MLLEQGDGVLNLFHTHFVGARADRSKLFLRTQVLLLVLVERPSVAEHLLKGGVDAPLNVAQELGWRTGMVSPQVCYMRAADAPP